jgi:hypothetical protein
MGDLMIQVKLTKKDFKDIWLMKVRGTKKDCVDPIDAGKFLNRISVGNITIDEMYS